MANYAFVTILTVMVAALMMSLVTSAAQAAVARGGSIQIADAVRVCLAAGLTFLIMRQVMPMASGLASGLALSSFGAVSALLAWGLGRAVGNTGTVRAGPHRSGVLALGRLEPQGGILCRARRTRWDCRRGTVNCAAEHHPACLREGA